MEKVFSRPKSLKTAPFHYCPGCGHSIIHRLIGEVIDEMNLQEKIIGVPPAGCAVLAYNYFDIDMGEASHGRAAAVATGLKRALPDRVVFTYQGDGDMAAIGTAESIHAAARGENITTVFVNNGVYGMTGGQMAPTTILGQSTTTSPRGRKEKTEGFPINLSEMLAIARGSSYIERTAVNTPANILKTKKAIAKAFRLQLQGYGFTLVEILSACPTNWKMDPVKSSKWIDEVMMSHFPLGVLKDITGDKKDAH
ncbi:MAG: thiamine pyrophosphate-dependent enzyme [Deltaproteobacteria bacterium]|nr:thiamine pyrophosphate-dependent enzyme [Deltaproteobacteria bacterium]MDP3016583.1 thiamine pyrophosphate-dependent enzyme [Deltaproteobacteria bacterium]